MASKSNRYISASVTPWTFTEDGPQELAIRVKSRTTFIVIPFNKARQIVDDIHDLCDAHDTTLREDTP